MKVRYLSLTSLRTASIASRRPCLSRVVLACQQHSSAASTEAPRLRRSVHFVPGDNEKFLSKCLAVGADTIVLDLEDSVKVKSIGREKVRSFLESSQNAPGRAETEILVRINPISSTENWREDIEAGFIGADGFMVPKVESRVDLEIVDEILTELEKNVPNKAPKVLLPIATETPFSVLNIAEIAKGPRVCAITWGCEDLSAELGSFGTRNSQSGLYLDVFRHCRNMCLLAAKAAGVQAIDGIYQDIRDDKGFEQEAQEASYSGFDGKLSLHPTQVPALHRVFAPSPEELQEALAVMKLWEGAGDKGSLELAGRMIDLPHYTRAKKVVARMQGPEHSVEETQSPPLPQQENETASKATASSQKDESTPNRVIMGKYLEDLKPGLRIPHFLTRTVTESDNVFFTCLTLNPAPIHLDHELSKENSVALGKGNSAGNGKPLFNSMFTLALLVGMSVPEATHGTTVANLGFSEVLFPKPVYPGDTLRAETMVVDRRESKSRPSQGIVTLQHIAYNQRGDIVCKATRQALMHKRSTKPLSE